MVLTLLLLVIGCSVVGWLGAFWYANDFSVAAAQPKNIRNVLVVFPHADDETNITGLAWLLKRRGAQLTFVVLTRGENGTPDASLDRRLKAQREAEVGAVCRRLGGQLIQEDFGDGNVASKRSKLESYLRELVSSKKPELVITYDLAGLYGHEDHIVCAEVLTKVMAEESKSSRLWYVAPPARFLDKMTRFPTHMARDPLFRDRRSVPDMRIFVGRGVFTKIAAVYSHKSQRRSFRSAMPWHLPIWLIYSLQVYEYYKRVQ